MKENKMSSTSLQEAELNHAKAVRELALAKEELAIAKQLIENLKQEENNGLTK